MNTSNPNQWIYLAVAANNGWATRNEPLEAIVRAVTIGRHRVATVVLYYVQQDTWDVDFMGGIRCSDITKGVPTPVGVYEVNVELDPEDEIDWRATVVTPTMDQEFMADAWRQWGKTQARAAKAKV